MFRFIMAILLILPLSAYPDVEISNNKLSGIVLDQNNNAPLPGVSIFIPEIQKGTVSNSDGSYLLEHLPNGKLTIQFSFVGYESIIKTVSIDNETTNVNVSMSFTSVTTQDVVVSGGFPSAQHENSIKISVINNQELDQIVSPSLGDKLSTVAGVDAISYGPGVSMPVIRGLSLNNIIFLNNGVRMENYQFSSGHPFLVSEIGADRIEIIKGPASLLYGSDAMGGVINILKEKPAPANTVIAEFTTEHHSVSKGYAETACVRMSNNNWFLNIHASKESHKDFKDGNGDYVPNTRFNTEILSIGMGLVKEFGSFKIYYDYLQPKLGMTSNSLIGVTNPQNRKNYFWYQNLTQHVISSRNRMFLGKFKLEANAAYQFNNRQLKGDPNAFFYRLVDMDLKTFTYESKLYFPSTETTEFLIGLQGMHQSNEAQGAPNKILPNADIDDFSLFSLVKKRFNDKMNLQFGLRYDHRSISVPEQEAGGHSHGEEEHEGEHEEESIHLERSFDNLNASLGATFHVSDNLLLRTNFATGYRVPNLAELTQHGLHGNRFEEGNAQLDPQKSFESDFGLHFHSKKHKIDFSLFYNKVYDYIYLAPTNEPAPEGFGFIYRYGQQDAKLYGGELSASFVPVHYLELHTDLAMVIGKQDKGGRLPFIPQHKWNNYIKLQGKSGNFFKNPFFKIDWKYAFDQDNPSQFETKTSSYNLWGLQAGTSFGIAKANLDILAGVSNLFNETYIDHLSTMKPLGLYNPGRNVNLKISLKF